MHKLFLDDKFISGSQIEICDETFRHVKALRLNIGDEIIIGDKNLNDYYCTVKEISKNSAILFVNEIKKSQNESPKKIVLFQALTKADKFEFVIQKSVELGVNKIIPIVCDYCDKKNSPTINKLMRWRKISQSAAEQSGRGIIPEILEAIDFKNAVTISKNLQTNFIAHEKSNFSIKNCQLNKDSIGIFIGPEGGFSESEINFALNNNIISVSLGKRILRTETAALFILSLLVFENEF